MPTRSIYIDPNARSPRAALVEGVNSNRAERMADMSAADEVEFDVYLVDGDGGYHADSGDPTLGVTIAIGDPGILPTSGTFTLAHGVNETSELSPTSTAAEIQAALEALPSVGDGNVTVTGSNGNFDVAFDLGIPALALTDQTNNLYPNSTISINAITPTSFALRIYREPLAQSSGSMPGANKWTISISLNNPWVAQVLAGKRLTTTFFEVQLQYAPTEKATILQAPVTLRNETIVDL